MKPKPTRKKKLRRYLVPAIVHGCFGCELEVDATSADDAERLVTKGFGEMPSGCGYDWNRWSHQHQEIGNWRPTQEIKE